MEILIPFKSSKTDSNGNEIVYFCTFISTSATDETLDQWTDIAHPEGKEVKIEDLKRKYTSKIANNTDYPVGSPNWVDMGALNSFSCFDNRLFSQTTSDEQLEIVIDTSRATTVAMLNMQNMTSVTVEHFDKTSSEPITDSVEVSLRDYGLSINNYAYEFFYKPVKEKKKYIHEVEWHPNSKVKLTFPYAGNTLKVGAILSGQAEYAGISLREGSIGQENLSKFNTDNWGNTTVVPIGVIEMLDAVALIDEKEIDTMMSLFEDVYDNMCLFITDARDNGIQSANVFGFLQKITIPLKDFKKPIPIRVRGVK